MGRGWVRDEPGMGQGRARGSLVPRRSAITECLGTRLVRDEPGTGQGWVRDEPGMS